MMLQVGLLSMNIRVYRLSPLVLTVRVFGLLQEHSWQFYEMRCSPDALAEKLNAMLVWLIPVFPLKTPILGSFKDQWVIVSFCLETEKTSDQEDTVKNTLSGKFQIFLTIISVKF